MGLHSLKLHDEKVILRDFTCVNCKVGVLCEECIKADSISKSEIKYPEKIEYVQVIEETDEETYCRDDQDNGLSDYEESDASEKKKTQYMHQVTLSGQSTVECGILQKFVL